MELLTFNIPSCNNPTGEKSWRELPLFDQIRVADKYGRRQSFR